MLAVTASAQQTTGPAAAPVPEQIATAKTVFISNAGADGASVLYTGGDNRTYNQFYAAMKSWGRYDLTTAPAGADLVFELLFTNPQIPGGTFAQDPRLRLRILDPSTHVALWTLNVHVKLATMQGPRDKNFDDAMDRLMAGVKDLAARH
jgi:hypothetical protein